MKAKNPPRKGFACRFDAGEYTIVLDREGMPDRSLEVRVELKPSKASAVVSSGFLIHSERSESVSSIASRIIKHLDAIAPNLPKPAVLAAFQDAATHWLLFNFGE
jgi:hypothetical protein